MPYEVKEQYKDFVFDHRASESSLRSISDRGVIISNKFRLKAKINNKKSSRRDYLFQSSDTQKKSNKGVFKLQNSFRHDSVQSSRKRLENNSSHDVTSTEKNTIAESPAYKQPTSMNVLRNYHQSVKHSASKDKKDRFNELLKAYNMDKDSQNGVNGAVINKIFTRIDEHLEKYSAQNSSRNDAKAKARDRSLVLPSLSKRPGVYEVVKSVDLKHSNQKEISLNKIRKLTSNHQSKKVKILSLKGTPVGK
jgi:hypothetical protein